MTVCFPVNEDAGIESEVHGHFGSAPRFVLVDADTKEFRVLDNPNAKHEKGQCSPLAALSGEKVDAVVVGGIGAGALNKLMGFGAKVYRAETGTVSHNLDKFIGGALAGFSPAFTCGGHAKGGGCSHH